MAEEEEIMIMEEEEMSTTTTTLPREILMEILSWIPAKSLLSSFKFVCKAWRSIIKDPDFVKMHLNRGAINGGGGGRSRSNNNHNNGSLIRKARSGNTIFQLHPPFNCEGLPITGAKKMDFDFNLLALNSSLVGSCNGLLCLSIHRDESIILLNPSTRKYTVSPKEPIVRLNKCLLRNVTYGFGCYYNSAATIDEYKVVRIVYFYPVNVHNHSFQSQIDIYSMSSNSWRRWIKVEDVPSEISVRRSGVFLNGALHWMGCSKLRYSYAWDTIVSFRIRDEEFGQVQMPPCADVVVNEDGAYPYIKDDITLMNVRGCLGNVYFSRTEMMDIELEIWVMKEYGIGDSWTKEFVIKSSDSDPPRELFEFPIYSRSMTCFLAGDQILIEGRVFFANRVPWLNNALRLRLKGRGRGYGRRVLYDMNKKKIDGDFRMFEIPCAPQDAQVDYIETLVSLKSSVLPLNNNRKRKDMESLRNQQFEDVMFRIRETNSLTM